MSNVESENPLAESSYELELPYILIQHPDSEDFNLNALCRVCLTANNIKLYPLFSSRDMQLLSAMYTTFTDTKLVPDDGLPSNICELCCSQLLNCYNFKMKCLKAEDTLKSLLKEEIDYKDLPNINKYELDEDDDKLPNAETLGVVKDEVTDVQYLEELSDNHSDSESLFTIQKVVNSKKAKSSKHKNDLMHNGDIIAEPNKKSNKRSKSKSLVCTSCAKRFSTPQALQRHVTRSHPAVVAGVPGSDGSGGLDGSAGWAGSAGLTGSVGSEDSPEFPCGRCRAAFATPRDLELHRTLHARAPPWICVRCQKEFSGHAALRRHVSRHMERKRHECAACGARFAERYALRRHARVHTGQAAPKPYQCDQCDKRFTTRALVACHLAAAHGGARPWRCGCGAAFAAPRLLASHRRVHDGARPHRCRHCDRGFRHESTRNTHERTHTGERPYVCATCGKRFIQNSNLTLHMRTHTGEKPYVCATCGRRFASCSALKSHGARHAAPAGEHAATCDVCGKRVALASLAAHQRLHSGAAGGAGGGGGAPPRPHACALCSRTFARASRLRDHERTHTGEKPFECSTCTLKFTTKSHLRKHTKTHENQPKKLFNKIVSPQNQENEIKIIQVFSKNEENVDSYDHDVNVDSYNHDIAQEDEVPIAVSEELILQDDSKSELIVVDDQIDDYQSEALCLSTTGVNFVNDVNYASDVNLVTVGGAPGLASTAVMDATSVKLYQLDQSLVQIQTIAGQVTISKITSKMTTNF